MMEANVFRIVDATGKVHGMNLTSGQATAMMQVMLAARPNVPVRSERCDQPISENTEKVQAPAIVIAQRIADNYLEIEPGKERETLRKAIEDRLDAAARVASADEAVDRASGYLIARQDELDALTESLNRQIAASGATLAALLKAGSASADTNHLIDRGAVLDATMRRDTAKAALDQLEAELAEAESAHTIAETCLRLTVHAVKAAEHSSMVERLEKLASETRILSAEVEAARFADIPLTPRATDALRAEGASMNSIDEAAQRWHKYTAALMEDGEAQFSEYGSKA
ncbi:hypothetical protein [Caballeronia sordidicola]|uniref:Uncharacterized protein n=1 Tax=Caballeronia sordidicola TaxID=196367 RepID=A0A242M9G2_CABSO|nr:hypothetical protein [Caballeronia sordidicola]OTP67334.1 hypothetical protein PAMC26510_31695 [Caballeronia sordidicola]